MRPLALALLFTALAACEKKPAEEEAAVQEKQAEIAKKATPTPPPGDWMWKQYKNPLEKK